MSWIRSDPDNIRAGAALLRGLLDRFGGDLSLALAAYHLGEARVRQTVGMPSLPATQLYVDRVLGYYERFRTGGRQSVFHTVAPPPPDTGSGEPAAFSRMSGVRLHFPLGNGRKFARERWGAAGSAVRSGQGRGEDRGRS